MKVLWISDFGIKHNILRNLKSFNFQTTILNSSSSIDEIMKNNPKGIFLSNGPGDPYATTKVIRSTISDLFCKGVKPKYIFLSGSGNKNHFTKN